MEISNAIEAFQALSQETRLSALRLLVVTGDEGLIAGEITRQLDVPHNTLSTHLSVLVRAGLVRATREGRQVRYRADFDGIRNLTAFLLKDCCRGDPAFVEPLLAGMFETEPTQALKAPPR